MSRIGKQPITIPEGVEVKLDGIKLSVKGPKGTLEKEYTRELQINGVGYRVAKQGNNLNLTLGYSHPVVFEAPAGITFDVPNQNQIIVRGIDKELVGQTAANIRTKRPPEVYRGKGIKYADEVIRRKEGKTGK